jgi:hypothetical protein
MVPVGRAETGDQKAGEQKEAGAAGAEEGRGQEDVGAEKNKSKEGENKKKDRGTDPDSDSDAPVEIGDKEPAKVKHQDSMYKPV